MNDLLTYAEICNGTYSGAKETWTNDAGTVHVFLSESNGVHNIAWEGTSDFLEWIIDFMAVSIPLTEHPTLGFVPAGWAADVMSVIDQIDAYLDNIDNPVYDVCGHSNRVASGPPFE